MLNTRVFLSPPAVFLLLVPALSAQWSPNQGQWGKLDDRHVRLMTWNVEDGVCSSNAKRISIIARF